MLTQHYSAQQRRALNQIWTAAEEYGFDPMFMAFHTDKTPDLYMNCIVGTVRRVFAGSFGIAAGRYISFMSP